MKNLTIVMFVVVFLFQIQSCGAFTPEDEKRINYKGKWKLVYSSDPADSIFLETGWILLQSDSLFYSNYSFYWQKDSLRNQSLHGQWSVGKYSTYLPFSHQGDRPEWESIKLDAGSRSQLWLLSGKGREDSTLQWYKKYDSLCYSWKLME